MKTEVLFLGHIVGKDGVHPNPKLIEAIADWGTPGNVKQVQQFLGLCNYYRRFIHQFSSIASPLTQLTKKDTEYKWTEKCEDAFGELKKLLCEAPVLGYPMPEGKYVLDTDASDVGIGGVLSQIPQRRYCITRRELLAVVAFVHQFRHFLLGREFEIRTDYSSLRWLCNFHEPQGQMARWLEVMSQYHFTITHRGGKKHQNADALSRLDYDQSGADCYNPDFPLESLPCRGCNKCRKMQESWSLFHEEVDCVVPMGKCHHHKCRRVQTRSMEKSGRTP